MRAEEDTRTWDCETQLSVEIQELDAELCRRGYMEDIMSPVAQFDPGRRTLTSRRSTQEQELDPGEAKDTQKQPAPQRSMSQEQRRRSTRRGSFSQNRSFRGSSGTPKERRSGRMRRSVHKERRNRNSGSMWSQNSSQKPSELGRFETVSSASSSSTESDVSDVIYIDMNEMKENASYEPKKGSRPPALVFDASDNVDPMWSEVEFPNLDVVQPLVSPALPSIFPAREPPVIK